jgi:hypothetical protein
VGWLVGCPNSGDGCRSIHYQLGMCLGLWHLCSYLHVRKLEQEEMCCGYCGTELLLMQSIVSEICQASYAVFSGWHNAVNYVRTFQKKFTVKSKMGFQTRCGN